MKGKNLPCWKKFIQHLKNNKTTKDFDFICKDGDISRINARFRLAKSFEKIELSEYSEKNVLAYSAIMKLFLVYSVFENYVQCIYGKKNGSIVYEKGIFILKDNEQISKEILNIDKNKSFYELIKKFLDRKRQKEEIDKFYQNEEHNIVYLISSIRHTFVHGKLTPNFNKSPTKVIKICNLLSEYVLKQIGNDFAKRICSE